MSKAQLAAIKCAEAFEREAKQETEPIRKSLLLRAEQLRAYSRQLPRIREFECDSTNTQKGG